MINGNSLHRAIGLLEGTIGGIELLQSNVNLRGIVKTLKEVISLITAQQGMIIQKDLVASDTALIGNSCDASVNKTSLDWAFAKWLADTDIWFNEQEGVWIDSTFDGKYFEIDKLTNEQLYEKYELLGRPIKSNSIEQ